MAETDKERRVRLEAEAYREKQAKLDLAKLDALEALKKAQGK